MDEQRDSESVERTSGGSEILRHKPRTVPTTFTGGDGDLIDAISDHIEANLGPVESVFHEIISDLVHIDVHRVEPTDERPWLTLVTSGMSELPMNMPGEDGLAQCYAELFITLPADWKLSEADLKDENWYWPIRWLKTLARLPHEYDTWLGPGHTVPNGDPPEPIADRTGFCCMLVLPSPTTAESFDTLTWNDREIDFLALVPLYREEMDLKLREGTDELVRRLAAAGITDLVNVRRKNVAKRKRFFGLF